MRCAHLRSLCRSVLRRSQLEQEMADELQFHMAERAADLMGRFGLPQSDAVRMARLEFGSVEKYKAEARASLGLRVLDEIRIDLRYAIRSLRRTPVFALAAILTLALGIGANTTVFTWVKAVLLRPVPGASAPDSLYVAVVMNRDGTRDAWSYPEYRSVRLRATTFEPIAQNDLFLTVAVDGHAERGYGALVSGNYFQVMGVGAAAGRLLTADDDRAPDNHPVLVLSHPYWQRRFGGDRSIVGRTVVVNNIPMTVVGVSQPGFIGSFMGIEIGAWIPLAMQARVTGASLTDARGSLTSWVRLGPGATRAAANAEIEGIMQQFVREDAPTNEGRRAAIIPPREAPFGAPVILDSILTVLSCVVMLVLAIACANAANLFLSRSVARRREMAIRVSVGASRARLVQQLLTESILLALAAGVAAVIMVYGTADLLMAFVPPLDTPIDLGVTVDGPALAFALAISLLTGVLFGLAPAWQGSRSEPITALQDTGGRGVSVTGHRLRSALVVVQVAVCLTLLIAAGLFMRSLAAVQLIDPGFSPERQLSAAVELPANVYTPDTGRQLYDQVLARVAALPGVESAAFSRRLPLGFRSQSRTRVQIDGDGPRATEQLATGYNVVSRGYFDTMGIPIVAGREFSAADIAGGQLAVIINETMARQYWGDRSPLGARLHAGDSHVIVGIARDSKYGALDEAPQPHLYFSVAQRYVSGTILQVRTADDPMSLVMPVRDAIRAIDPGLAVWDVRPVISHLEQAFFAQRLGAITLGTMSALALLLAAVGLYGVVAHAVSQRTQEMGIRLALGASPAAVRRKVVADGLWLTLFGLTIGLAAALGAAQLLASLLPGIEPRDPVTFVTVPTVLLAIAFIAAWLPAVRASRIDPVVALR
jgi:predicted permease